MGGLAIEVRGESLTLLPERALTWPARRTVAVADLHVGKDTAFRAAGVAIPPGSLDDDLARLGRIIDAELPDRLLVLGDLTHSRSGLSERVVERIAEWRRAHPVTIVVVRGNHDRHLDRPPAAWNMELIEGPLDEGPFAFRHHPASGGERFVWAGHVHPVVRLRSAVETIRLPCFHLSAAVGVLPAFSAFTGGGVIDPAVGDRIFPVVDGRRVLELSR
jgi:DNA ligase-associated metallophosphoesterase